MKKSRFLFRFVIAIIAVILLCLPALAISSEAADIASTELYPGGMPFGVKIISKGLIVVGFSETHGDCVSPAFTAGVRKGDVILKVDECDISSIEDFVAKISASEGKEVTLTVLRGTENLKFTFYPQLSSDDGRYKTGLWVKDSASGIGTITFINSESNAFAGLGHGICDASNGKLISLSKGIVMDVTVNGVVKGKVGSAGELKGHFNQKKIGTLSVNCDSGVFGLLSRGSVTPPEGKMKVCPKEQVQAGEAYIWCTLGDEKPQKYKIQLSDIDTHGNGMKNFKIKVTDKTLIERSGGIVQGMSGSPIIQNGKIVGAVTHVLINDPTQGYGIFIENMLNAMPEILK